MSKGVVTIFEFSLCAGELRKLLKLPKRLKTKNLTLINLLPCPFFGFKASYSAILVILIARHADITQQNLSLPIMNCYN